MLKRITLLLIIALIPGFMQAQDDEAALKTYSKGKMLRKARRHTTNAKHLEARKYYLKLVEIDSTNPIYNYELGLNYFYYAADKKANALPYFERAARYRKNDTLPELHYLLAETYHLSGNYEKAVEEYNRFKPYIKSDSEGLQLLAEINAKITQSTQGKAFDIARNKILRIENLGSNVNSKFADYVPVISQDERVLMFTSRRNSNTGGKIDAFDEKFYEDMFISRNENGDFTPSEQFKVTDMYVGMVANSPKHDAVVGLSPDEKSLFTYRDNSLWVSTLKPDGTWNGPMQLSETINAKKGFQPHASVTSDGNILYFSSERKEGLGGLDIYQSVKQNDIWGKPENLGASINTKEDQDSPHISEDGTTLYFSSKGHSSVGGYDIFKSEMENGTWSTPVNLGAPINSTADDIYYLPAKNKRLVYFSSNRKDGFGDMDLYRITYKNVPSFKECEVLAGPIPGKVSYAGFISPDTIKSNTQAQFDASVTQLRDKNIQNFYWNFDGYSIDSGKVANYIFPFPGIYNVKMEAIATDNEGEYYNYCIVKPVNVISEAAYDSLFAIETATPVSDKDTAAVVTPSPAEVMTLESVYFARNSFALDAESRATLNRNIKKLKANSGASIILEGHSDATGPKEINYAISKKRSDAVAKYLFKNGVPGKQIVRVENKGKDEPVNNCTENVECTDEQHRQNRRVEFLIEPGK